MKCGRSVPGRADRGECIGDVACHLMQGEGLDRGIDWMLEVNRSAGAEEVGFVKGVTDEVLGRVLWAGSGRDGAAEIAERLERIHAAVPIEEQRLAEAVRRRRGTEALELIEKLSAGPVLADDALSQMMMRQAMDHSMRVAPEKTRKWVEERSDQ